MSGGRGRRRGKGSVTKPGGGDPADDGNSGGKCETEEHRGAETNRWTPLLDLCGGEKLVEKNIVRTDSENNDNNHNDNNNKR